MQFARRSFQYRRLFGREVTEFPHPKGPGSNPHPAPLFRVSLEPPRISVISYTGGSPPGAVNSRRRLAGQNVEGTIAGNHPEVTGSNPAITLGFLSMDSIARFAFILKYPCYYVLAHTVVLELRAHRVQGTLRENQIGLPCKCSVCAPAHRVQQFVPTPHLMCPRDQNYGSPL